MDHVDDDSWSHTRYSKKVKRLLGTYDLSPAPKIVEVDLRGLFLNP
jgi:hypothetical protein